MSTGLKVAEVFRRHGDCLYALQATIPQLTRSSLRRLFQRYGISRLPNVEGNKPRRKFKTYAIGYFHIDIAEVLTEEGRLFMLVAIDRVSKFAFAETLDRAAATIRRRRGRLRHKPWHPPADSVVSAQGG